MRSIWKGSLVFGLVNVPVAVYSATEDHDVKFHQVHESDGGRIRYQRVCEIDGEVVPFAEIGKAFTAPDGRTVMITDDDFKTLPEASTDREIDLLSFVPADQIDPVLYESSYLLEPTTKSPKAYLLLREVLAETDRVAIVHFALRQKTRLAALRVREDVLVLQTLRWPDEVRAADFKFLDSDVKVAPAEKQMASLLVDSYADDFHPDQHSDDYRIQLEQLIEAKLEGEQAFPEQPAKPDEDAEVLDLLAALQRSVERHKGGADTQTEEKPVARKKTGTDDAAAEEKPAPRKRAAASKPATRRTTSA